MVMVKAHLHIFNSDFLKNMLLLPLFIFSVSSRRCQETVLILNKNVKVPMLETLPVNKSKTIKIIKFAANPNIKMQQ